MQSRNHLFICGLFSGRGGKIGRTWEHRSLVSKGRCVVVAAPGRRGPNDSWRKGWSIVGCFCFCALWSGALLLSADGQRTSAEGKESSNTSEQLVTTKVERVRSKPVEEAVKNEKPEGGAAVLAAAGDSQQRGQKKDQSTTAAAANLNDGTPPAPDTNREVQEHPNPKEDDAKSGKLDVPSAAAAAAESHTEKPAQRTKKEKESHAPTLWTSESRIKEGQSKQTEEGVGLTESSINEGQSEQIQEGVGTTESRIEEGHSKQTQEGGGSTERRIKEGQSKQTREGVGSRESTVKAGTAAVAKDSDQEQEEEWEEVATKTPAPATALRGFTTSKETLEGDSSASTSAAARASAIANEVGGPDAMNQCTRTDAHTIFWRTRVKSGSINAPLLTNNPEDSDESLGLYGPINPFYETVLSCGRSALAQKDLTEVCIQARLEQLQREPLTKGCVACFTESVSCGADHCRSSCFLDTCAEKCLQCTNEHCRPALERCVGLGQLPPICVPEEATTSQEEDEEKADGSRQQKAWNTFFHRFAETEEESR